MKLPSVSHLLSIDVDSLCAGPFPPCGFLPLADAELGNGDCFGLYWPLGQENKDPIVCELYHDEWRIVPTFSSAEKFIEWLEVNDYEPYENGLGVKDDGFAAALFSLARERLSSGRLDDALPLLVSASERLSEVSEYWLALAGQHRRRKEPEAAANAALSAYLGNWAFGAPDAKVIHLLAQAANLPSFKTDPVIQRVAAGSLDLNYGGVKENANYPLMQECIDDYLSQGKPLLALRLLHNYAYAMYGETTAFQERYGFDLAEWQTKFGKLCLKHLNDARSNVE
ncbi:hypothetical protein SOASR030_28110 [Leminorella grimontii]|uniref:Tetratricopeptide repeat protein n=1 Tax=Leminorella grimontii TaxID=82981 RepID=A0AAV5N6X0_9GAMM|nr:hypothetical protein [Leminorella grimontii]KFC94602.1 hypothetical protein GLGR_2719 [Leminorella grimontii ATCC 33999 = DSM 5078]GKX56699.1 hypothetical protein SOASR030_28110 [Leminorella grimontii]VFS61993.1 Uncharacterised protein [Leminorella grimontii]